MDITKITIDPKAGVSIGLDESVNGHNRSISDLTPGVHPSQGFKEALADLNLFALRLYGLPVDAEDNDGNLMIDTMVITSVTFHEKGGCDYITFNAKRPNGITNSPANFNTSNCILDTESDADFVVDLCAAVQVVLSHAEAHLNTEVQTTIDSAIADAEEAEAEGPELTVMEGGTDDEELTEPASDDGPEVDEEDPGLDGVGEEADDQVPAAAASSA